MKQYLLLGVLAIFTLISCGEEYEEPVGPSFGGIWRIKEYIINDSTYKSKNTRFISVRDLEKENVIMYFTNGSYDSSFIYRLQIDELFVRRIKDIDTVYHKYLIKDSVDASNKPVYMIDTLYTKQKPIVAVTDVAPEIFGGTISFSDPEQGPLTLTIKKYNTDIQGQPIKQKDQLYLTEIYERTEKE